MAKVIWFLRLFDTIGITFGSSACLGILHAVERTEELANSRLVLLSNDSRGVLGWYYEH